MVRDRALDVARRQVHILVAWKRPAVLQMSLLEQVHRDAVRTTGTPEFERSSVGKANVFLDALRRGSALITLRRARRVHCVRARECVCVCCFCASQPFLFLASRAQDDRWHVGRGGVKRLVLALAIVAFVAIVAIVAFVAFVARAVFDLRTRACSVGARGGKTSVAAGPQDQIAGHVIQAGLSIRRDATQVRVAVFGASWLARHKMAARECQTRREATAQLQPRLVYAGATPLHLDVASRQSGANTGRDFALRTPFISDCERARCGP